MSYKNTLLVLVSIMAMFPSAVRAQDQFVVESARQIPVACDVDVVVVGGSSAGHVPSAATGKCYVTKDSTCLSLRLFAQSSLHVRGRAAGCAFTGRPV